MARPKSREARAHLSVNVSAAVLAALDAEAQRLTEELHVPVNRTGAVSRVLEEWRAKQAQQ